LITTSLERQSILALNKKIFRICSMWGSVLKREDYQYRSFQVLMKRKKWQE